MNRSLLSIVSRRSLTILLVALGSSCQAVDDDLPPIQLEGAFIRYASEARPCPDTVVEAEAWLLAVAARLQIGDEQLEPITYFQLDRAAVEAKCEGARACTLFEGDGLVIYSPLAVDKHELVHALHLSVWDLRPALLQEGLATLFDDEFSQSFVLSNIAWDLEEFIEAETQTGDLTDTNWAGAALSYWVLQRHGVETLIELWDQSWRGMSAPEFSIMFETVTGESLGELVEDVSGESACQLATCYGPVHPWDGQQWRMQIPGECADDVIGMSVEGSLASLQRLVEITEAGWYELSADGGEAFVSACGDCAVLDTAGSATVYIQGGDTTEVSLVPGIYRVEARWLQGSASYELRLQLAP